MLLCCDLMLVSSVQSAGSRAGVSIAVCRNEAEAAEWLSIHPDGVPLIDLSTPGLNLRSLTVQLNEQQKERAVAWGPHVHRSLLITAEEQGIGCVLSRGAFHSRLDSLLAERVSA